MRNRARVRPSDCRGRSSRRISAALAVVALLLCALPLPGADTKPVYTTVSFRDRNHLFIENLERNEVQIRENGELRDLEFMAREELPTVYGLLFETGLIPEFIEDERHGSRMISAGASAKNLAYELIDKYLGKQALWVGAYDREMQVLADFSGDGFRAKEVIQQLRGGRRFDNPFLYGALFSAIQKMNARHEKRRVLIVFMNLADVESSGKAKLLRNLISASNVEVFFVSFARRLSASRSGLQPPMSKALLKEFAQCSAGEAYFSADYGDHLEDLSRTLYNHIRTLYTFGFSAESPPGKPGALEVRCGRPGSKVRHHPTVPVLQ